MEADMATDFTTLVDTPITLKKGAAVDFEQVDFQTANVNTATNASVEFLVIPAGAVTLTIEINGTTVVAENFTSTVGRVWRENFSASILKKDNTLTVAKNGDGEDITVQDFLFLFKTS
jgi:hypothetical protein